MWENPLLINQWEFETSTWTSTVFSAGYFTGRSQKTLAGLFPVYPIAFSAITITSLLKCPWLRLPLLKSVNPAKTCHFCGAFGWGFCWKMTPAWCRTYTIYTQKSNIWGNSKPLILETTCLGYSVLIKTLLGRLGITLRLSTDSTMSISGNSWNSHVVTPQKSSRSIIQG